MSEFERELLRAATRRTLEKIAEDKIVTPERYSELFREEEKKLLEEAPSSLSGRLESVQREVETIRNDLYRDGVTLCHNRLWLYRRKLDERQCFLQSGILGGLRLHNLSAIRNEYGEIAAERVARLFADSLRDYFSKENTVFDAVRYHERKCLLLFEGRESAAVPGYLREFSKQVQSRPFRYRNRRLSLGVNAVLTEYAKGEPFYLVMDRIEELLFKG